MNWLLLTEGDDFPLFNDEEDWRLIFALLEPLVPGGEQFIWPPPLLLLLLQLTVMPEELSTGGV